MKNLFIEEILHSILFRSEWQNTNKFVNNDWHTYTIIFIRIWWRQNRNDSKSQTKGVNEFYLPAIDSESSRKMFQLEAEYPNQIFAMMGLHPCYVKPETWEKN